jgi:hypothetical protein
MNPVIPGRAPARTRNLEIPGSLLSHRPRMTAQRNPGIFPLACSPQSARFCIQKVRMTLRERVASVGASAFSSPE